MRKSLAILSLSFLIGLQSCTVNKYNQGCYATAPEGNGGGDAAYTSTMTSTAMPGIASPTMTPVAIDTATVGPAYTKTYTATNTSTVIATSTTTPSMTSTATYTTTSTMSNTIVNTPVYTVTSTASIVIGAPTSTPTTIPTVVCSYGAMPIAKYIGFAPANIPIKVLGDSTSTCENDNQSLSCSYHVFTCSSGTYDLYVYSAAPITISLIDNTNPSIPVSNMIAPPILPQSVAYEGYNYLYHITGAY
jgi:hypothetical protein